MVGEGSLLKILRYLIGFVLCVYVAYISIVDEVIAKIEDTPEPQRSMILDELLNNSDSVTWGISP